ncbi:hypothetical protein B0H14DRAFT_3480908 [Mycena olivaceomarginata]|nr:hypothetical protein B0H14DRAFT_3480908 [Mycena olivaceomarginata]
MHRPAAEPRMEDTVVLKFADHLSLFFSFWSVKFEWSGLDGMRSVRRRYNSSCPASPDLHPHPTQLHTGAWDPIRPPALPLPLPPHADVHHSYSHPPPPPAAPEHSTS